MTNDDMQSNEPAFALFYRGEVVMWVSERVGLRFYCWVLTQPGGLH